MLFGTKGVQAQYCTRQVVPTGSLQIQLLRQRQKTIMYKIVITFGVATILASAAPAYARDQTGFYVGVGAGSVIAGNTRANGVFDAPGSTFDGQTLGDPPSNTAKGQYDPSMLTGATVGYDFGKRGLGRLRFEGEFFYHTADTDGYKGLLNGSPIDPAGRVNTKLLGVAANVASGLGEYGKVSPYVTLGVGYAKVKAKYEFPNRGQIDINGNSVVYQAGVGLDIAYNESTTFDVKYRFRRAGTNVMGIDGDFDSHVLELGVRYKF